MARDLAFQPWGPNLTKRIPVTATSAETKINDAPGDFDVRIFNDDTQTVFIEFGVTTAITAVVSTSLALAPGSVEVLHVPPLGTAAYIAVIGAAANSRYIYVTPGNGI